MTYDFKIQREKLENMFSLKCFLMHGGKPKRQINNCKSETLHDFQKQRPTTWQAANVMSVSHHRQICNF
jgi:hypothetical protein